MHAHTHAHTHTCYVVGL